MAYCIVCSCTLGEKKKGLRNITYDNNSHKTLFDFVSEMVGSPMGTAKVGKLYSDASCLPCYRKLTSLAELHTVFHQKRQELLHQITENCLRLAKTGKRKADKNFRSKVLTLSRELVQQTQEVLHIRKPISLDSIIGLDGDNQITAEITITEDGNGGAAIDFEVVDESSDLKKSNGLYGCRFCKKEFISSSFSITHMQEVHGKVLHNCDTCGIEFRLKADLDQHRVIHLKDGPLPFQCGNCPKGFSSLEKYNEHIQLHEQKKKHGCAQCGRKFLDESKLNIHMANHKKKPFSCHRCKKAFRSFHSCTKHQTLNGEAQRYNCNLCNRQFTSAASLHLHLKNHNKTFKCGECGRGFDTEEQLHHHVSNHHNQKRHECTTCGKFFVSLPQLESHIRIHTGERPFQCDTCGATFAQRSNLDSHHRAVHLQEKRFKCQECDKSFKRRRLLNYHIRSIHTGERPFSCPICNATFVYPEHYKKHLMTHSGNKPYACEICGKTFSSKDNRNTHRFTHSHRKPYECTVCGSSFMRMPHLLKHFEQQGHGSPETAGAAVKIVQVLTGPEVEPASNEIEWSMLDLQDTENLGLDAQDTSNIQAIIIPDGTGRHIEIQVMGGTSDSQETTHQLPFDLNGEAFRIAGTSISEFLKQNELQECTVEETLESLL